MSDTTESARTIRLVPAVGMAVAGAALAALVGFLIIAIPVVITWLASPASTAGFMDALRTSGVAWLVADDVPVRILDTWYSLLPWGLLVIPIALLAVAGRQVVRTARCQTRLDRIIVLIAGVIAYAVIGALVSWWSATPDSATRPGRAAAVCAFIALVGFGWGVLHVRMRVRAQGLCTWQRVAGLGAVTAVLALIAIGAILLLVSFLLHFGDAVEILRSLNPGAFGGLVLLLLGIGYLPALIVWSIAYAAGTAVTISSGTTISAFLPASEPAVLPPFPALAAVPTGGGGWQFALPILIVVAGALAGFVIARRYRARAIRRAGVALVAAGITAIVMAILAGISSGSLGRQMLHAIGPKPPAMAVSILVLVAIGAVAVALAAGKAPVADTVEETGAVDALIAVEFEDPDAEVEQLLAQSTQPESMTTMTTSSTRIDNASTQIIPLPVTSTEQTSEGENTS